MTTQFRDDAEETPKLLLLLSHGGSRRRCTTAKGRVFECKTCKISFPTFQALGGHMTGHKRPREGDDAASVPSAAPKKVAHECPICGLVFPLGQALGGHMRRHKDVICKNGGKCNKQDAADSTSTSELLLSGCSDARGEDGLDNLKGGIFIPRRGYTPEGACFVDLELRLGLAPPALTVYDDALLTTLRLGIEA